VADYGRRQRVARVAALATLAALVLYTRLWGCSYDQARPAKSEAPAAAVPSADAGLDGGEDEAPLPDASPPVPSGGVEHILLLGLDRSGSLPGRTDAILIVAVRHDTGDVGVVSVPRDLWVRIPGEEPGRINKVLRLGAMRAGEGSGLRLLEEVILAEMGIDVDYALAVDFAGFERAIDTLGGIDVEVECPIRDNFVSPGRERGYEPLCLSSGRHRLDGHTALLFARSRHGRTDLDRARRQQAVLLGIKNRATSLDALPRLADLWLEAGSYLATDLDLAGAMRLLRVASSAGPGMVHGLVLGPPVAIPWRTPDGKSVLLLDRAELDRAMGGLFSAPAPGARRGASVCPAPDAALGWRERRRRVRSDTADGGPADGGPAS